MYFVSISNILCKYLETQLYLDYNVLQMGYRNTFYQFKYLTELKTHGGPPFLII